MRTKTGKFGVILFGVIAFALLIQCEEFDQNLFGVVFDPNVKQGELNSGFLHSNYTLENLRTMMKVVSTKFTRIISTISPDADFNEDKIYYNTDDIRARIGQAAALVNLERKTKSLAVIVGLQNSPDDRTQFHLAVEAAKVANFIYPGTVEGIWLVGYLEDANITLLRVENLRTLTKGLGIKVGSSVNYESWKLLASNKKNVQELNDVFLLQKQILNSDFIVIDDLSFVGGRQIYTYNNFSTFSSEIIEFRNKVKKIGNKTEVIRATFWYAPQGFSNSTAEILEDYWVSANKFAMEEEFQVWMAFAFSVPNSPGHHTGWWRLSKNELINNVSGYIENVSGEPVKEEHFEVVRSNEGPIQSPNPLEDKNSDVVIGSSVVGGFALLLFLNIVIYLARRRRRNNNRSTTLTAEEIDGFFGNRNIYDPFQEDMNLRNVPELNLPYDANLEIAKENLEILWDQTLGGGQFGLVCKAILKNKENQEVALKMAKDNGCSTTLKGILSEIKILSYLGEHPNIVSITGAYTAELRKGIAYLAMELCQLGSLKNHLREIINPHVSEMTLPESTYYNTHQTGIPLLDLVRWSYEIASGMEYLEEKNVVHADLATRNVLLTADKTAKVTDFGLSRRLYEYSNYAKRSQEPLPWRWLAIESLKNLEFSVKSDVWSYGVTIWEIFSFGDQPFPGYTWSLDFIEEVQNGLRMRRPRAAPENVFEIMTKCWNLIPQARPSFSELRSQMRMLFESTKQDILTQTV